MGFKLDIFLGGALMCQSRRQFKAKGKKIEFLNIFLMANIDFSLWLIPRPPSTMADGFNPSKKQNLATSIIVKYLC